MKEWEYYCDVVYYDMWAVRPKGDKDFNSQQLFHVMSEAEAKALVETLNGAEKQTVSGRGKEDGDWETDYFCY